MLSAAISGICTGIYPSTASESSGWAVVGLLVPMLGWGHYGRKSIVRPMVDWVLRGCSGCLAAKMTIKGFSVPFHRARSGLSVSASRYDDIVVRNTRIAFRSRKHTVLEGANMEHGIGTDSSNMER